MRTGSIIADLVPTAEQVSWLWEHRDVVAGFVGSLNEIVSAFLHGTFPTPGSVTPKQAERISQLVEPVAKDRSAQMNIVAQDHARVHVHNHFHIAYLEANAVQNGARRLAPPKLPSDLIESGVLLTLEQVKNSVTSKTGDRGVIEKIARKPVRLRFLSPEAKRLILDRPDNPLKRAFLVDVRVHLVQGEPRLYEIIEVHEVIDDE